MGRFAFVVAASRNYTPGLRALVNSVNHWHRDVDILLVSFRLAEEFLSELPENTIVVHSRGNDQVRGTAIERFRVAAKYGGHYDAVCLLDADMFLTADCGLFFEVAAKGFIVTGSNGMIISFDREYQERYGIDLGQPGVPHCKVHTTAPIFLSEVDLDWFETLYDSRRVDHWDDFLYLNILGLKLGKDRRMLCLPPYAFTGIHHWQVKPETAILQKAGMVLSGTEERTYSVHGKWWDEGWLKDIPRVMGNYFRDHDMGEWCERRSRDAVELAKREFWRYHDMGKNTSRDGATGSSAGS